MSLVTETLPGVRRIWGSLSASFSNGAVVRLHLNDNSLKYRADIGESSNLSDYLSLEHLFEDIRD